MGLLCWGLRYFRTIPTVESYGVGVFCSRQNLIVIAVKLFKTFSLIIVCMDTTNLKFPTILLKFQGIYSTTPYRTPRIVPHNYQLYLLILWPLVLSHIIIYLWVLFLGGVVTYVKDPVNNRVKVSLIK